MRDLFDGDRRLYMRIHLRWRTRRLDPIMVVVTQAGTKGAVWFVIAVGIALAGVPHGRDAAIASVAAMLLAQGIINLLLKPAVRRRRPYIDRSLPSLLVRAPGPHSWPSAHAGSAMAAAVILSLFYPALSPLFLILAASIAYSRVYVGVHYPADVLAGMAIGIFSAAGVVVAAHLLGRPIP